MMCCTLDLSSRGRVQRHSMGTRSTPPPKLVLPPKQKCTVFPRNTVGGKGVRAKEPGTASDD